MFKRFVILLFIGRESVLTKNQFRQVKRETVRIFEREYIHSADLCLTCSAGFVHQFIQQTDTLFQGTQEGFFLGFDNRSDLCLLLHQLRIGLTHVCDELRHELIEESRTHIEEGITVTNGTTENTTNDITRFLVARQLTVRNSKRYRTDMIRNHAHRDIGLLILTVFATADSAYLLQHRLEHIRVVVRGLSLNRSNQTLKAHTRINHFLCKRLQRSVRFAVILHEDNIPNLYHLRVIFVHEFTSGHLRALFRTTTVYVNLTTRTTRTRIAHFPEVIMFVAVQDMISRQVFGPYGSRLFIPTQTLFRRTLEDGCIEVTRVDLQHIHNILPCEINRFFLEVIAEGPVPQHLEHRVVIRIVTYLFQVIMFSAHAQTLLTVRYSGVFNRVIAQDDTLPRVHTGIGKHQCRIIFDDHRRRRNHLMSLRGHKI